MRINAAVLFASATVLAGSAAAPACPVVSRYPANTNDGQASMNAGAFPFNIRAADDFVLPLGNGNDYNIRIIKFVMISNFTLNSTNVGITVYNDGSTGTTPPRPIPGSIASGTPNAAPDVRDLGPIGQTAGDGRPFNAYEITYHLPAGFLRLPANRWYWLSPWAQGGPLAFGDSAFVALGGAAGIVGEVINKSDGLPGGGFGPWTLTTECCLGPSDIAMFIDAVQIGRPIADLSCDGLLSVQDLFDFLAVYFSGAPAGDFNGIAGTSVQDIFDFLATYFAGT